MKLHRDAFVLLVITMLMSASAQAVDCDGDMNIQIEQAVADGSLLTPAATGAVQKCPDHAVQVVQASIAINPSSAAESVAVAVGIVPLQAGPIVFAAVTANLAMAGDIVTAAISVAPEMEAEIIQQAIAAGADPALVTAAAAAGRTPTLPRSVNRANQFAPVQVPNGGSGGGVVPSRS